MESPKPKSPLLTVLLNCIFLGMGYFYTRAFKRGGTVLVIQIGLLIAFYSWAVHPTAGLSFLAKTHKDGQTILAIGAFILLFFALFVWVNSYKSANRFNKKYNLERKKSVWKTILIVLFIFLTMNGWNVVDALRLFSKTYIVEAFKIPSSTMRMTLFENDRLLVDKGIYRLSPPQRGDIAVFKYPEDPQRMFIKRVVGLGGETVEIREGDVFIDGKLVELPVIKNKFYYSRGPLFEENQQVRVPSGHYFVLGDNSASSHDSRFWGFVPEKNIVGKAFKIYYPFDRSGPIE